MDGHAHSKDFHLSVAPVNNFIVTHPVGERAKCAEGKEKDPFFLF